MGARKQKWTAEEEAALIAGIEKHGLGKWCLILKDHQFNGILKSRSNVDLKDKWRNLCVIATGSRSQTNIKCLADLAKAAKKDNGNEVHSEARRLYEIITPSVADHGKNVASSSTNIAIDSANQAASESQSAHEDNGTKDNAFGVRKNNAVADSSAIVRFNDLILEDINCSKEPFGASQRSIKRISPTKSNLLTAGKRIIEARDRNRLVRGKASADNGKDKPSTAPNLDFPGANSPPKTIDEIEAELIEKMSSMTPCEAAAHAAEAVAEAEAAISLAEAAAKDAQDAETVARNARFFAEASDPNSTYFGRF